MRKSTFPAVLVTGSGRPVAGQETEQRDGRGHYGNVNGMRMYYEVHGKRRDQPPLVLLHGALSATGTSFGAVLPTLAQSREVISIEQQGHGHTADIDRPLRTEVMAEDTVELVRQIGVRQADFFGYSMGGEIALDIAVRHPDVVRKLVFAAAPYNKAGYHPGILEGIEQLRPEDLFGSPFHEEYLRIAPRPQDFPILVEKVNDQTRHILDFTPEQVRAMRAPTLIVLGDSDVIRPEHAVEMFRLLGGGVAGDVVDLPDSQLAMLPGTTHVTLASRPELLLPIIPAFLDRPMPT
jgi:pimeloyl-ACP methyl ester carboxylesterase